jgi:hypothetical protein
MGDDATRWLRWLALGVLAHALLYATDLALYLVTRFG